MRVADVAAELTPLADLEARLTEIGAPLPMLVVRLPALERTAWRQGLRAARLIERKASEAFATAAARVLRSDDLIAHDRGSDVFVAALAAPTREKMSTVAPVDARSALARISATMESMTRLDCDTGWTRFDPRSDGGRVERAVHRALARGAQERERYAFFSAVGHELRTPLSSIRGYLETLLADDIDARTRKRFVSIAYNESLRLTRLIEGMFEISMLDLQATFPTRTNGSLDLALEAASDACVAAAAVRSIDVQIERVAPTPVAMDGDRLTLVFINLIDNAIKHGRLGGTVSVAVDLSDRRFAHVFVDDDGPGVPAVDRERLFALGERGATSADGSGIGLALVRLMLERVGGRVEVVDAPLGGARFALSIPRRAEV